MKNIIKSLIVISSVVFSFNSFAEKVTIVSDSWLPYTGETKGPNGFIIDVAREAFTSAGYEFEYKTLPWSRAIKDVKSGQISGLAGCTKDEVPSFIFPKIEQGMSTTKLYIKSSSTFVYNGVNSLKNINVAVVQDYSYGDELDEYILNNSDPTKITVQTGDNPIEKNLEMLELERVDAVLIDESVATSIFEKKGYTSFVPARNLKIDPISIWIGFSPKHARSRYYAKVLETGLSQMRRDGRLSVILKKYGIKDWKNSSI